MKKNRIKLIVVIFFTIAYMISALIWWTIALRKLQYSVYEKESQNIKLKNSLVANKIFFSLQNLNNENSIKTKLLFENQHISIDTQQFRKLLGKENKEINIFYLVNRQHNLVELRLLPKDDIHVKLLHVLKSKQKAWMMEGLTLGFITILIGIAMFVYLDRVVRLNQQQNNFLLAVTHELKTPIAASNLAIQTAIKRPDPEIIKKMLGMAQSNIARLSSMVEQILMATRFENKFTEPQKININLSEFIGKTIQSMDLSPIEMSRIHLNIQDNIYFLGDEHMLSTVFKNLINNAFKYSEDEGMLNIEIKQNDTNLTIAFSDEGIGIPDAEKKNVFEKFYRVGEEKTRTKPGSGLGLYLVKKITEIHGGKVSIFNNQPKGTIFILNFSAKES